ncbi:MAG: MoaD/ThiS family protein [Planctomycetia bacterium]|nr:MoaD/ThiS family protein [Planctomycetia bacterium]
MSITVELFGIPRQRAGIAKTQAEGARLDEVLLDLARRFPRLAEACIANGRLQSGYLANLNGQRFVSDPSTALAAGDSLLILSADAGG